MGVDATLYAAGYVSDRQLAAANAYMRERGVTGNGDDQSSDPLVRDPHAEYSRVKWDTWHRYYGPGYERGHWPTIHNAIVCLRAALPHCRIFYGTEEVDPYQCRKVTDEWLAEIWAHWLGPDGCAYHRRQLQSTARLRQS